MHPCARAGSHVLKRTLLDTMGGEEKKSFVLLGLVVFIYFEFDEIS
jgi:hypothetical protein